MKFQIYGFVGALAQELGIFLTEGERFISNHSTLEPYRNALQQILNGMDDMRQLQKYQIGEMIFYAKPVE